MNKFKSINENYRPNDNYSFTKSGIAIPRINSKIEFFNDSGERIWEPLHNKTVIAGSALTAMKLFNFDRNVLDSTPTYDEALGLYNDSSLSDLSSSEYPTVQVQDTNGTTIISTSDECQRKIIGFCVGQGGAGLDVSDVFDVNYCDWIKPENIIPFKYPTLNGDDVDEDTYKGKKIININNQNRVAYYFKTFSNTPSFIQSYINNIGSFDDTINKDIVYTSDKERANSAQSYVEMHLKITKDDCREFFIAHRGIENAKINQLSLVSAWTKTVSITKLDRSGNVITKNIEYFKDIRPFSLVNIATEIMSDLSKSISIIYTLYF